MTINIKPLMIAGGIIITLFFIWAVLTTVQVFALRSDLSATRTELARVQTELEMTEGKLIAANNELSSTRTNLASTEDKLTATQTKLSAAEKQLTAIEKTLTLKMNELDLANTTIAITRTELSSTSSKLTEAQQTATTLENTLSVTQQQLAVSENTLKGLGISISSTSSCADVTLVDNPKAVDPTHAQLMSFLAEDTTEYHPYTIGVYDCSQFSRDLHNRAEAAGIRCAEVQVRFTNSRGGHALNAFLTTDYGLIYVDCTEDPDRFARINKLKVYRSWGARSVPPNQVRNNSWWDNLSSFFYILADNGGQAIVESITIFW